MTELGNTKTNSDKARRSRAWCFTLNNYKDEEKELLIDKLTQSTVKFVVGKEVGSKTGTKHLQGYAYFKNPHRLVACKKINDKAHWEIAKGSPKDNLSYCTKEDSEAVVVGFDVEKTFQDKLKDRIYLKFLDVKWKPWQAKIIELVNSEADSRTINWVYDKVGNSGKSYLTKYLALTHEIIIADGKKDNIFNQVNRKLNEEEKEFKIVVLDIPRSSEGYINYGVLEQLKNGLIYSGKYEGGICLFDDVHVIVFANFLPELEQFSLDRWNIINITDEDT